ncbi:uncharacterized protein LOC111892734 [Lactuca sativa]|uniref:uncharacterized protein LOC111892734 n=1 Tax=Lactuca sativa TaxID=4236 RepID=UPI000CD7E88F|nr:uncharacterized protein LOC111892734 [Lactuca sativa]
MLELEHQRQIARETLSPPTAMAAVHSAPSTQFNRRRQGNMPNGKRPNSQQSSSSSAPRRNPTNQQPRSQQLQQAEAQPWFSSNARAPYWAYWSPPPCPHPTTAGWNSPWNCPPSQPWTPSSRRPASRTNGLADNQAHLTAYDPMEPTQTGEAFQAMNLEQPDEQWYMDSGATDHLTGDQGLPDRPDDISPQ